jgi:hypothetical protein
MMAALDLFVDSVGLENYDRRSASELVRGDPIEAFTKTALMPMVAIECNF